MKTSKPIFIVYQKSLTYLGSTCEKSLTYIVLYFFVNAIRKAFRKAFRRAFCREPSVAMARAAARETTRRAETQELRAVL